LLHPNTCTRTRDSESLSGPAFDIEEEYAVQQAVRQLILDKLIVSAHDNFGRWPIYHPERIGDGG